jgi:hypothetical protein
MGKGAIRSFTTEVTEATEVGKKGFRIRVRTLLSFPSVSVISVDSVVKSGADVKDAVWLAPKPASQSTGPGKKLKA